MAVFPAAASVHPPRFLMNIVLKDLTKIFPKSSRNKSPVTAVDNFNIEIPDGKLVGLLGPSGCGKSTALNLISGLEKPTHGRIFFGGTDVTDLPPERRGVGMVFQNYALYPHLTVRNNILFPLQNLKGSEKLSKEVMEEKVKMDQAMRKAVEDGCKEFEVYFQPIMEIVNGVPSCCGSEALVRWNSPEYGLVVPDRFIAQAEQMRLIIAIGDRVMQEAVMACKHWNDFGHPEYKVNINLSVVQLTQMDILDKIRKVLEDTLVNPKNITFEVTESLAVNDMEWMVSILNSIKALGCRVALDDFGTGYSSLNHIRTMPIDTIKIDKAFVSDMDSDSFSETFIKTISELADSLDMDVCVEGVEMDKQVDMIGKFSVNLAQGYYFDRPLTRAEFEKKYI